MIEAKKPDDDTVSLLAFGTILLRHRWRIVRWSFIGGLVAALSVISTAKLYLASASFVPQGSDAGRSGLASLAGQFGVSVPTGDQSLSPDFYAKLLKSRVLLLPIVRDTLVVPELGGKRIAVLDLLGVAAGSAAGREVDGVDRLKSIISPAVVKGTAVVELTVKTRWRSVSLAIATALVDGVNTYNERRRQSQAAAEREFIEGRLAVAGTELRAAEDRLGAFLRSNREFGGSAELQLQRERLQRDVSARQQLFNSLTQSFEEARIREVRDTPVITAFEAPWVPVVAEPRGRLRRGLLGLVLGAVLGVLVTFTSAMLAQLRQKGDPESAAFIGTLGEVRAESLGPFRKLRGRLRAR